MADVNINTGHIGEGTNLLVKSLSPMPPFRKANVQIQEEFVMGTDFASADNVILQIPGITKAFVVATTDNGTIKTYTEAVDSTGTGKKFTFANVTTNLKVFIITDV
jgi:hypothetical protein